MMRDLLFLLPVATITIWVALIMKKKKGGTLIVSKKTAPARKVMTEDAMPPRMVLEYKHHVRVASAPEPEEFFHTDDGYKHEFEEWVSPFISTPFSKN